jgi:predicted DNA-binding transcriptional regulator YafY
MPVNKSAFLRYRIIDGCLTNPLRKYPDLDLILDRIETQLGKGISVSMLNKDIGQMKEIYNAPIKYDRIRKGYCYTQEGFSIKEFPLTNKEIEALDMSTALLHQLKGTKMFQHFETAINKVIEGYRLSEILGKSENQILQVEEPVRIEGSQWLEIILDAIVYKKSLQIKYQSFNKPAKMHHVSPYLLKEYRNRWYLVGYTSIKENLLVMALDRIVSILSSKNKFVNENGFIPNEFFKFSFGITQLHNSKPEKVILSFSTKQAPYILTQPLHHSQVQLKSINNDVCIELYVYLTQELKMTILSYGAEVKVIKPKSLRDEIQKTIKEMVLNYK